MNYYKLLVTISMASIILPNIGGILAYRKLDIEGKKILLFFGVFMIVDFTISWLANHNINNMPMFNIFSILEYGFYAYLFYSNINNRNWRKGIYYSIWFFSAFTIFAVIFIRSIYEFNSEVRVVESLFLVFCSLLYFSQLSNTLIFERTKIFKIPMFWISIGVLFYFAGNFFLFLFFREISQISPTIWSLHSVVNIITNSLFMISFLCRLK
ncbi:MAG: hypothetical protein PSX81_10675 [bacterium]|nr:hypothetical protein [bacterium]